MEAKVLIIHLSRSIAGEGMIRIDVSAPVLIVSLIPYSGKWLSNSPFQSAAKSTTPRSGKCNNLIPLSELSIYVCVCVCTIFFNHHRLLREIAIWLRLCSLLRIIQFSKVLSLLRQV